jgi:tRNA pseudouridine55 synthase
MMDGFLNINKGPGLTSHDVVAKVRRIVRQKRVGHAGTLDPLATGVLPVALGKATRLLEYLSDADKAYLAELTLGAASDTYDREGVVTPVPDVPMPPLEELQRALDSFRGEIDQLPPMYSAVKVGGKKLYELARSGVEVTRTPRRVIIHRLDLKAYEPPMVWLFVECSKGTYIRSLAHDLGAALGTGAHLHALERTRHGPFNLEEAVTLDKLGEAAKEGEPGRYIYPPEYILQGWRMHKATPGQERDIRQGKPISLPAPTQGERPMLAAKSGDGELLAVLYWSGESEAWQPKKVFSQGD